ncbi:MAG: hypothetical protein HRT38_19730 [Alteromonadaceae bacterium]|nr:hypothetical protein [Alteromonadaceae bacterium]
MELTTAYLEIWDKFTSSLKDYNEEVKNSIDKNEIINMHSLLKEMSYVPYDKLHLLADNIGAATGLFFEHNVQTYLVASVKSKFQNSEVKVSYNKFYRHKELGLPRDPDIVFKLGSKEVVVELKVAPKKRDFEYMESLHSKYEARSIAYYFIGNYLSVNKEYATHIANLGWACIFNTSTKNSNILQIFPTFDELVNKIVKHLKLD